MYSNPYINYYVNQAGSGIGGFQGVRFQRGQGFFGNFFRNAVMPLLKYLGPKILKTGTSIASDAIAGENVLQSLKTHGKEAARDIASDVGDRVTRFAQTGTGNRKRKRSVRVSNKGKIRKISTPKRKRPAFRNSAKNLSIFE